ncbi:hypothetical protein M5K25_004351 [Dendrobium thyrsiflorum]|uniref:Uncharacterized protein n=1 Tax=Dendrobium thyrsiflorum TaxID=117978 RepID=A0ABD0VTY6_DENTH
MDFSSTFRSTSSPASLLYQAIVAKPVNYSLFSRTRLRNPLRASCAVNFRNIGSVSRVYEKRFSNLSHSLMRPSALLPILASKRETELNSGIADARIVAAAAATVILAVANRVLYKLALVPMRQYPFFLAQVTTFGEKTKNVDNHTGTFALHPAINPAPHPAIGPAPARFHPHVAPAPTSTPMARSPARPCDPRAFTPVFRLYPAFASPIIRSLDTPIPEPVSPSTPVQPTRSQILTPLAHTTLLPL